MVDGNRRWRLAPAIDRFVRPSWKSLPRRRWRHCAHTYKAEQSHSRFRGRARGAVGDVGERSSEDKAPAGQRAQRGTSERGSRPAAHSAHAFNQVLDLACSSTARLTGWFGDTSSASTLRWPGSVAQLGELELLRAAKVAAMKRRIYLVVVSPLHLGAISAPS